MELVFVGEMQGYSYGNGIVVEITARFSYQAVNRPFSDKAEGSWRSKEKQGDVPFASFV